MIEMAEPLEIPPDVQEALGRLEAKRLFRERLEKIIESGCDDLEDR